MPKKRRKLDVVCLNQNCKCYNKKDLKNIVKNGYKQNGTPNYKCIVCNKQFVRTKGTIFYHKKLNKNDVANICRHIVETNSLRGVARETQHNKNTICSYVGLIAKHCEPFNNFLLQDVKLGTYEIDEFWTFVKKNKKKLSKNTLETMKKVMHTAT